MKKRFLAMLILLTILVAAMISGRETTEATPQRYQVGYGIRDINPWVDPNDHSKGVLPVELHGNGNNWERICTGFMDDNDDGVVGEGDGVFTTATAVTDPYGETMIYITIDSLQGYSNITADVRNALLTQLGIRKDHVMVNGNHTHSGANYSGFKNSSNPQFKAYYEYIVQQIVDASVEAYNDRAEAVMSRGSIDATDSTAYLGYNSGKGYHMNAIRHYDVTSNNGSSTVNHVAGSNFGGMSTTMKGYKQKSRTNALESDNTMYVLLFEFPDNNEKEPIIFVNWRAHSTTNSGGANKTFVSGDYANSIRANMKKKGYRAAFFQGASGNVVTKSTVLNDWAAECYKEYGNYDANTNVYGRILTDIALDCVDRKMTQELPAGKIKTMQITYHGEKQEDSEGYVAAAQAYQDASAALGENKFVAVPYSYTHTDGKTYIINSKFHASNILTRHKTTTSSYTDIELNAILMGDNVAFVTIPNEIADRLDLNGSLKDEDNDWLELINDAHGMPFVLGYTNDGKGYIPFSLEYAYNTAEYFRLTGKSYNLTGVTKLSSFFAPGSYESNTSRFARGTGEAIVQKLKQMLTLVGDEPKVAYCEACKKEVEWTPLIAEQAKVKYLGTGHYYLLEDQPEGGRSENQKIIDAGEVLCYDLNGHKVEAAGRNFNLNGEGAVLNIMDSAGGGQVISYSGGNNVGGGVITVISKTALNIYGGTFQFIRRDVEEGVYETGNGGVISCSGTVNMYGGTLIGGEMRKSAFYADTADYNGCGGTVYLTGSFNAYGGRIIAGKAAEGAHGDCVNLRGNNAKFRLGGDAMVDNIYFDTTTTTASLTISGAYTGTAELTFKSSISNGKDIGAATNVDMSKATITCTNNSKATVAASGSNLILSIPSTSTVAVTYGTQGIRAYNSLKLAASGYTDGVIQLQKNDTSTVTVNKDMIVDLAGHNVTGVVTVAQGTLYCMDTETDDYTVADNQYGKITNVTGNISAVQNSEGWQGNRYMMISGADGKEYSFHRIDLGIYAMTLRPEVSGVMEPGVYYKSYFLGDEKVQQNVASFGVALSVSAMPNASNMETACKYSSYTQFQSGSSGNDGAGVLLKGIMKDKNSDRQNAYNATVPVYGNAYMLDKNGNYIFGVGVCRSLQEQLELIDRQWDTLGEDQAAVMKLCDKYEEVTENWEIPNIQAAQIARFNADLVFTSDNKAWCPVCEKDVAWTAITQATHGTTGLGQQTTTGLHYYLAEDITYTGTTNFVDGPAGGKTMCIHLNGHNFTGTQAQFLFGYASKSRVMGNGIVSNGRNSDCSGAVIWNTGTKTNVDIHLYGGTYTVTPDNTKGSAISIQNNGGEIHIHKGVKVIGSATAPAIYVGISNIRTSQLYIDGATVEGTIMIKDLAVAKGYSTTVVIEDSKVSGVELGKNISFTVAGDTVIEKLQVTTGAKLTVGKLEADAMITVAGDGVISEINANMADYLGYFKPVSGKLWIEDNALVAG